VYWQPIKALLQEFFIIIVIQIWGFEKVSLVAASGNFFKTPYAGAAV